jgi:general secretion pathway protein L
VPAQPEELEASVALAASSASGSAASSAASARGAAGALTEPPVPVVAAVLGAVVPTAPALLLGSAAEPVSTITRVELAIARGLQGEGLAVSASQVNATLDALAGTAPRTLYLLTDVPGGEPGMGGATGQARLATQVGGAQPLPFEKLARRALECRFDLCQFEFAVQPWRLDRGMLRRLRLPVLLAVGAILVAIIGANVQWLMLSRQRDAISAQMTETLLNTFPKTTVVLDAPGQMTRQMQQLRVAAGELSPDDFLTLAAGLARSLGPLPVNGLAALDYHDHRLDVTFKPEIKVDSSFTGRLAANGLSGAIDSNTGKWTIRSAQ